MKKFIFYTFFLVIFFLFHKQSVIASESISMTDITISAPQQPIQPGDIVTLTVNATASDLLPVYYKFYYCGNYGTASYATTPWVAVQDYSTTNTCNYSFPSPGNYVAVVRAVKDPQNEPTALPIIGGVISVGGSSDQVNISSFRAPAPSSSQSGGTTEVSVNASIQSGSSVYYKFYYCGNYGAASYDTTPWVVVQDYSTTNTCNYSFPSPGNYIAVVRAVKDPQNEPSAPSIIGGVINVNSENGTVVTGKLNDTGLDLWADNSGNKFTMAQTSFPGQDADYGRDKTTNDDSDGHAGFSFTKIGNNGETLPVVAAEWYAVMDNVTGLMWEVKSNDNKLHHYSWNYSWYEPDYSKNNNVPGKENGGSCGNIVSCDTYHYIQAVNDERYCGYNDWRLPTLGELLSIADFSATGLTSSAIDTNFFPNTLSWCYWSSTQSAQYANEAWRFVYDYATSADVNKNSTYAVMLVRGSR